MLPTEDDIAKLSLRGIVAYAARAARRASPCLSSLEKADVVRRALANAESVVTAVELDPNQAHNVATAAAAAVGAMGESPPRYNVFAALSIFDCAMSAVNVLMASHIKDVRSLQFKKFTKYAAHHAHRAVQRSCCIGDSANAIEAARRDYHGLVRVYGVHLDITFGESIDIGPSGPLGPLWPVVQ